MAPESNSPETTSGQTVRVPVPANGAELVIQSSPGGQLTFEFDPSEATGSRVDNSLVFDVDGGGRVIIEDFFVVGDEDLPLLELPDGLLVAASDFFDGSGLDMTPAEGPSGPSSMDGSGTSYNDDPGALMNGLDRLGMLGTQYWGRDTEVPINDLGNNEWPGGTYTLDPVLGGNFGLSVGMYEDSRPLQHTGDFQTTDYAQLQFDFVPTGTTVVTGVHLTGFTEGTVIWFGHPDDPDSYSITITGADQQVDFTLANFENGVYVLPPANDDTDMHIDIVIDIMAQGSGLTDTLTGSTVFVVDAVADMPVHLSAEIDGIIHYQDNESTEVSMIGVNVKATFGDVLDGSEKHYIEMRGIPGDWILDESSLPAGWSLVSAEFIVGPDGVHGEWHYRFDVTEAATNNALASGSDTGDVSATLKFDPQDWTSSGAADQYDQNGDPINEGGRYNDGTLHHDGEANIEVRAVAEENPTDADLNYDNNTAATDWSGTTVDIKEDRPEFEDSQVSLTGNERAGEDAQDDFSKLTDAVKDIAAGAGATGDPLSVNGGEIEFNFYSDTPDEKLSNNPDSKVNLTWDENKFPTDLMAKEAGTAGGEYYPVTFAVDPDNPQLLIGTITVEGVTIVVMIGVLEPDYLNGTASITFIQYHPLYHPDPTQADDITANFGIVLTDNDGDKAFADVSYTVTDDIPEAYDYGRGFDEKTQQADPDGLVTIGGNLITDDKSGENDPDPLYDDPGSDGFNGIVDVVVTVDGQDVTMSFNPDTGTWSADIYNPGTGVVAGTLTVDSDGNWSFTSDRSSGSSQDVLKDFKIEIEYTYQDGDGDTAGAKLTIDVEAAPQLLVLTGTTLVSESDGTGAHGGPEHDHGIATYTLSLKDYNNPANTLGGEAVTENVTVKLNVSLGSASREDFDLGDPGYVTFYYKDADGNTVQGQAPITAYGYPEIQGFTFSLTIPAGAKEGSITFELPIADDTVGGSSAANQNDTATETYTVSIQEVTSNAEIEVPDGSGSVDTTILDDGTIWDPDTESWVYVDSNEIGDYLGGDTTHMLDGPAISLKVQSQTMHEDGALNLITITLNQFDENGMTGSAWTNNGGTLQEPISISINLNTGTTNNAANSGSGDGVMLVFTQNLIDLIKAGKVEITYGDPPTTIGKNSSLTVGQQIPTDDDGNFTVTLTESFNPSTDADKLNFNAKTIGDDIIESTDENIADEWFELSVTGSSGHESVYDGSGTGQIEVTDNDSGGYLNLTGQPKVAEGGELTFTLYLSSDAKGNTVKTEVQGDVNVSLSFSPSKIGADAGADYLSDILGKLEQDPTNQALLDELRDALGLDSSVSLHEIRFDGNGGFTIDLTIPPEAWNNGKITIKVKTDIDDIAGEPDENFTIKIEDNSWKDDAYEDGRIPGHQEIQGIGKNDAEGTITDNRLELSIKGDSTVYEEDGYGQAHGGSGWNNSGNDNYTVAGYQVDWGYRTDTGCIANGDFQFTVKLQPGSAGFWAGHPDDAPLDGSADIYWTLPDGNGGYKGYDLTTQDGIDSFIADMNALLKEMYGDPAPQLIGLSNGGTSLQFHVPEGTNLDQPLPLYVGTVDDQHADSGEKYTLVLGGLVADPNEIDVAIAGKNEQDTTIYDGGNTGLGTGQWLGLEEVTTHESKSDVTIGVRLYNPEVDGGYYTGLRPPVEDMTLTFRYTGDTATANQDFVTSANQTQILTTDWVAYSADGSHKIIYFDKGSNSWIYDDGINPAITINSTWDNFPAGVDGLPAGAYWEANPVINDLIADDRLTEGDESFGYEISSVTGNESAPVFTDKPGGTNGSGSTITITDDDTALPPGQTEDPKNDTPYLDGPRLEAFELNGQLREPVATDKDGGEGNYENASTTATYTIALTAVAAEDIIITLSLNDFNAELGKDYALVLVNSPPGLMDAQGLIDYYDSVGWPSYLDRDSVNPDGYYVIVPKGSSAANFQVQILHDHDTTDNNRGLDQSDEALQWTIEDMVGSEVQWGDGVYTDEELTTGKDPIIDDMKGPEVSIDFSTLNWNQVEGTITGSLQIQGDTKVGESIFVKLSFIGADGSVYPSDPGYIEIEVFQDEDGKLYMLDEHGGRDYNFTVDVPSGMGDYFYLHIAGTEGGETQPDTSISQPFYPPTSGVYDWMYIGVTANDIYEGGDNATGEPKSVTYDISCRNVLNYNPNNGVTFGIQVMNNTTSNEDFEGSNTVNIHLSKDLLDQIRDMLGGSVNKNEAGDGFVMTIIPDADGNPAQVIITVRDNNGDEMDSMTLTVNQNGELVAGDGTVYGSIDGQLPTAYDDNIIEGDEHFTPVITAPHDGNNAVRPENEVPGQVTIVDNDTPVVTLNFGYVDGNGEFVHVTDVQEGQMGYTDENGNTFNYVVRVSLTDGEGNQLVLSADANPVTITLRIVALNGTGTNDGDVFIFTTTVTLYPGQDLSDVRIIFPDDFISDDGKQFTIEAEFADPADRDNFGGLGIGGSIAGEEVDAEGNVTKPGSIVDEDGKVLDDGVTIADLINGPIAKLLPGGGSFGNTSSNEVSEGQSAAYVIKLDKALEEDASVTVKLTFDDVADTADGMTPDDISSLTIDGITYTVDMSGGVLTLTGPNGETITGTYTLYQPSGNVESWSFDVPMHNGSAGTTFTVNFNNDFVSEDQETLKVEITDAKGGEMTVSDNEADRTVETTVNEVLDGPQVSLITTGQYGTAMEGEEALVGLGLSKQAPADFDVTLKVQDMSVLQADQNGDYWVTLYADGQPVGTFQVSLNGDGSGTVTVTVPAGTKQAEVGFGTKDNIVEGSNPPLEVTLENVQGGEATMAGTGSYSKSFVEETHNSMTYKITGSESFQTDGDLVINLGKINGSDVSSITFNGKTYSASQLEQNADGSWSLKIANLPAGTSIDSNIKVTFKSNDNTLSNKDSLDISVSQSGGTGRVVIQDDSKDADLRDGPVFSVVGATDGVEGDTVSFTINVNAANGQFTETEEATFVTFTLSGTFDPASVTLVPAGYGTITGPDSKGVYTLRLEPGTAIDDVNFSISVNTTEDTVVGTDSGVTLKITGTSKGESSYDSDNASATAKVAESPYTEAALFLSQTQNTVVEGGNITFTLRLRDADNTQNMTASQNLLVTLFIKGEGINWDALFANPLFEMVSGDAVNGYYVQYTLKSGVNAASISIPTLSTPDVDEGERGVEIRLDSVTSADGSLDSHLDVDDAPIGYTITDPAPDFHQMEDGEIAYDASGSTVGMTIIGNDEDNKITGSAYADKIYGGDGNDTINSGAGNDSIYAGEGDNVINAGTGNNLVEAGHGNNQITAGSGSDIIRAGDGDNYINAGAGNNLVETGSGNDTITTGSGNDTIRVDGGDNQIDAGNGKNLVEGGTGDDTITTGSGADTVYTGEGDNVINTGAGNDIIYAGSGNNQIDAGAGDDKIYSGSGENSLTGGLGDDTFYWTYDNLGGLDVITDFSMSGVSATNSGQFGNDMIDLSDLFGGLEGLDQANLDQYLGITRLENSGDALLEIRDADQNVVQKIVLQDVYTNHSLEGNDDAVNALIMEHIILTNSGS